MNRKYKRWYDTQREIMKPISVGWLEDILAWRRRMGASIDSLRPIIDEISDKKIVNDKNIVSDNKIG